jgi:hypothetical protein
MCKVYGGGLPRGQIGLAHFETLVAIRIFKKLDCHEKQRIHQVAQRLRNKIASQQAASLSLNLLTEHK